MYRFDDCYSRKKTVLCALLCVALTGCQEWFARSKPQDLSQQPRTVYALGYLKPKTGVIDIRATPGDRLRELADGVQENKLIPEDGILGTLDSYDMGREQLLALVQKKMLAKQKYLQQKQMAAAQLAQASASKAQALAKQKELELQKNKQAVLEEAMHLEQEEYEKLAILASQDPEFVTPHQLKKQENKLKMATQEFVIARDSGESAALAAQAAVDAAKSSWEVACLAQRQARKDFDSQLETQLIDQEIEIAEEALKRSILLAPKYSDQALEELITIPLPVEQKDETATKESDEPQEDESEENESEPVRYTALKVFSRDGEVVTQAPIMQLGDLSKMMCVAEVYEADRKELFLDQKVVIRSPAFSGYYADGKFNKDLDRRSGGILGKVTQIGRMIAPPGLPNRNPLAPTDRSVVEVRIEIDSAANQKMVAAAKEANSKQKKQSDNEWIASANEMAARNVGLQVTIEFLKKRENKEVEKAKSESKEESAAPQAAK